MENKLRTFQILIDIFVKNIITLFFKIIYKNCYLRTTLDNIFKRNLNI